MLNWSSLARCAILNRIPPTSLGYLPSGLNENSRGSVCANICFNSPTLKFPQAPCETIPLAVLEKKRIPLACFSKNVCFSGTWPSGLAPRRNSKKNSTLLTKISVVFWKCADTRHIAARSHRRQDLFIAIYVHQQAHARHWHLLMSDGDVIKQHLLELEGLVSKHTPRVSTINAQLHRFQVKNLWLDNRSSYLMSRIMKLPGLILPRSSLHSKFAAQYKYITTMRLVGYAQTWHSKYTFLLYLRSFPVSTRITAQLGLSRTHHTIKNSGKPKTWD